jgi:hypothetical protein
VSTELEIRFCTNSDDGRSPFAALKSMVQALESTDSCDLVFRGLRIGVAGSLDPVHHIKDRLSAEDILSAAQSWDAPDYSLSTRTALVGWASNTDDAESETLFPARVEARGGRHVGRTGNWWIEGDARLAMTSASPFVFPTTADGRLIEHAPVRRNVAMIRSVTDAATKSLEAVAAKSYTDAGEFFPFNAHTAFYAEAGEIRQDATLVQSLFANGDAALDLPPLGDIDGDLADFVFHLWRSREERRRLQGLLHGLSTGDHPSTYDLEAVLVDDHKSSVAFEGSGPMKVSSDAEHPYNFFLDRLIALALAAMSR